MIQAKKHQKAGGVAISMLILVIVLSSLVGSYIHYSLNGARMCIRTIQTEKARIVAESAMDAINAELRTIVGKHAQGLGGSSIQADLDLATQTITTRFAATASISGYNLGILRVKPKTSDFETTVSSGRKRDSWNMDIVAGAQEINGGSRAAVIKEVKIIREPFLRYAIFYDDLLELHPGPPMTVNGDMHSNSQIELWCNDGLTVEGSIRCPGTLTLYKSDAASAPSEGAKASTAQKINVELPDGSSEDFYYQSEVMDSDHPEWSVESRFLWDDQVVAGSDVVTLDPPIGENEDNYKLLAPAEDSDSDQLAAEKMANKADLYILIDETGKVWTGPDVDTLTEDSTAAAATLTDSNSAGQYSVTNSGWINVHDGYYDPRESDYTASNGATTSGDAYQEMQMTDIYMDKLLEQHPGSQIVYVEVEDPADGGLKPAVRLRNGANLSASPAGITVATHRTTYVEGDYNTIDKVPALIAADNLTLLSNGWNDSKSKEFKPSGVEATTLNAAIMIGYSSQESLNPDLEGLDATGGAHNLLRFRENWNKADYNFSGSYISLWSSEDSACIYSGTYYSPPSRNIQYDTDFLTQEPPGMPLAYSQPAMVLWYDISWEEAESLATN